MMKKFFYTVLLGSFLAGGTSFADEEETPLGEKMSDVSGSLKMLRRAKDDYAKCLVLVREAQSGLLECFQYVPALIAKMPEGKEKAMAMVGYKKTMAESYKTLCDLEEAYLSEDVDKIDDALDAVKGSRKEGHQEYIEED